MINKKKKTGMYILMALITVLVVFPFIWMLVLSFKSNSEILSTPLSLPKAINFDNYKHAMDVLDFPKLYGNTIFVCVISGYRISNYIFQLFCNFKNGIQK